MILQLIFIQANDITSAIRAEVETQLNFIILSFMLFSCNKSANDMK